MSRVSFPYVPGFVAASLASAALVAASPASAAISASEVVDYAKGSATNFTNPSAALGLPAGDTSFGALTPFNPPFTSDQIVVVGSGGRLTLKLSAPVPAGGAGPEVGVFVNNGLIDVSEDGSGKAGCPPAPFSPFPVALVSVSSDGQAFVPLGAGPVTFTNPTNYYTDVTISNYSAPLGSAAADFTKPFTGTIDSFGGLAYPQIVELRGGSGGGKWIDVTPSGLASVQYVRFDVPAGGAQRLVLDAVTAVPEPGAVMLVAAAAALMTRRRRN
jgi:hypothetical protein